VGLDEGGRVVLKRPALEVDGSIALPKALLNRCSTALTVRVDLQVPSVTHAPLHQAPTCACPAAGGGWLVHSRRHQHQRHL
jgi:hypothetical protein